MGEQVLDRLNELSPPPKKDLPRGNSQFVDAKVVVGQEVHVDGKAAAKEDDTATAVRVEGGDCLLYTSPSPRDGLLSRMPSSA